MQKRRCSALPLVAAALALTAQVALAVRLDDEATFEADFDAAIVVTGDRKKAAPSGMSADDSALYAELARNAVDDADVGDEAQPAGGLQIQAEAAATEAAAKKRATPAPTAPTPEPTPAPTRDEETPKRTAVNALHAAADHLSAAQKLADAAKNKSESQANVHTAIFDEAAKRQSHAFEVANSKLQTAIITSKESEAAEINKAERDQEYQEACKKHASAAAAAVPAEAAAAAATAAEDQITQEWADADAATSDAGQAVVGAKDQAHRDALEARTAEAEFNVAEKEANDKLAAATAAVDDERAKFAVIAPTKAAFDQATQAKTRERAEEKRSLLEYVAKKHVAEASSKAKIAAQKEALRADKEEHIKSLEHSRAASIAHAAEEMKVAGDEVHEASLEEVKVATNVTQASKDHAAVNVTQAEHYVGQT